MRRKPSGERNQSRKSFFRKRNTLQTCEFIRNEEFYVDNPENHFQGDIVKKVRFRTKKDAKHALKVIKEKRLAQHEESFEKRVYKCKQCKGYHLTSQPDRFWESE